MFDRVKLREIINERTQLDVEDDFEIEQCRIKLAKLLTRNIAETNQYLQYECTEEEYLWISEVFDEIARITKDDEFVRCLYQLMKKYEKITEQYNIRLDIEEAEEIIEFEKDKTKNIENAISTIVRFSSGIRSGSAVDDGCNPELLERAFLKERLRYRCCRCRKH